MTTLTLNLKGHYFDQIKSGEKEVKNITHPHFGPDPVTVYAINVGNTSVVPDYKQLTLF